MRWSPQTHGLVLEPPVGGRRAGMPAGEVEDVLAQRLGGEVHRLAGDHRAGAGEGAGVVRGQVGVGIDDVDLGRARAEQLRGDLAMRR